MDGSLQLLWARLGIPADYAQARHLPLQREATRLVSIGRNTDGRIIRLAPEATAAWKKMQSAAAGHGVSLIPVSGFRSVTRQTKIIRDKISAGMPIDKILRSVAAPGCSEHHTGRALDLVSPNELRLDEDFARTAEYRWLKKHAGQFGFHLSYPRTNSHGIGYEPWHWCWHARARG